ncbi:hypothetical protein KI387_023971, partial [Taxus chinensis]
KSMETSAKKMDLKGDMENKMLLKSVGEINFRMELYPPIEPYNSGFLKVSGIHSLYWEQSGNPDGH